MALGAAPTGPGAGTQVRPLAVGDQAAAMELCRRDPVASVLAGSHVEALGAAPVRRQLIGLFDGAHLRSLCWAGPNVVPVGAGPDEIGYLARELIRRGRRCSSIVGPADAVLGLWEHLRPRWSRARDVRGDQPSLAISGEPQVRSDPLVRRSRPADFELLFPAAVAMFTEEVGYSPTVAGAGYEARVRELIERGRSFVRTDGRHVVFKAELGAVALGVAQVQGVWVPPELRGRGIATAGVAAVVRTALREVAPTVSLYVNSYNTPALAAYRKVGFRQVGTYATVLF